jgi:hypothetical protein
MIYRSFVAHSRVARISLLVAAAALAPAAARAQLEHKGAVSLSAERLFGLNHTSATSKFGGTGTGSLSRTDFGLFMPNAASLGAFPRLALDVAVVDGLTLGGALGVLISDASADNMAGGFANSSTSLSGFGFLISPRIGWATALGRATRLWLRGGVSYFRTSSKADNLEFTQDGLSVDIEPALVVMLGEHFGLLVTALVDLPLTGEVTVKGTGASASSSADFKIRTLGVVLGLAFTF